MPAQVMKSVQTNRVQLCCGKHHSLAYNIKAITTVKLNKNRWERTTVLRLRYPPFSAEIKSR